MQSQAKTVSEYLKQLPPSRKKAIGTIRKTVRANLGKGFKEGMQYGMIGYFVPHSTYPAGYHCDPEQPLPFLSVASQKNHMAVYLFGLYQDPKGLERFVTDWKATGKRLDMGKSCVRFKKIEEVPLEVLGRAIAGIDAKDYIARYEALLGTGSRSAATRKKASKKKAAKKKTAKSSTAKKAKKTARRTKRRVAADRSPREGTQGAASVAKLTDEKVARTVSSTS